MPDALRRDHHRHAAPGAARWPTPWPPRASGSCCSNGATSCPGRWTTGAPTRCSSTASTSPTDTWYDSAGRPFQPQVHYFVGRRDQALRRGPVPAAARRTSGRSSTWTASRRPGRSPTTTSSPGTPRPSGCTRCTATAARTRPRATGRSRTRGRRSATSPHAGDRDALEGRRLPPVLCPVGIMLDEARPGQQRLHPLRLV